MYNRKISLILAMVTAFLLLSVCTYGETLSVTELPDKYDLREENRLTIVKEQGGIGSCWAVTSVASLESYLLTMFNSTYDLSENNIITQLSDAYEDGLDRKPAYGGDDVMATGYYTSWRGPLLESYDPYPESMKREDIVIRGGGQPTHHVQGVYFLPERTDYEDNDLIKKLVMQYGAISASMFKGTEQTFGRFYNEDTFAWYYPDEKENDEGNGHAVNIVGWDDNFPKENFKIQPPKDGAFIVRNTKGPYWGRGDRASNMGGYFYISYYDGMLLKRRDSLQGGAVFSRVDSNDNYDNIYQYDILGYTKELQSKSKEVWMFNRFSLGDYEQEVLRAVSFYTLDPNLEYEIYYSDNRSSKPSISSLKKIGQGTIELAGYHTIDLDEAIDVDRSDVTIAVKLTSQEVKPRIAIESPDGMWSSRATAKRGQSYVRLGSSISDLTNIDRNSNVCLKLFTDDAIKPSNLISVEDMKKDVDFIVKWIKEHQPVAMLIGYTEEQKSIIADTYKAIEKPLTNQDFYTTINRLFTMMGDGHTTLYTNDIKCERHLDLPFKWINEGMIITDDTDIYEKGDRIISIGGMKDKELNKLLYQQISSENDYWVRYNAPDVLREEYMLRALKLLNADDTITIEFERDGKTSIIRQEFGSDKSHIYDDFVFSEWDIDKSNNLGYFRFDNFVWDEEKKKELAKEVDSFFASVAKNGIDNIAIDLRNNTGGVMATGTRILGYLDIDELYYENYKSYNYFKKVEIPEGIEKFKGNVFILTSNKSYSCSVYFLNLIHGNGYAYTIGEPTGENPAFNHHGSGADGALPQSGWEYIMTSSLGSRPGDLDISVDSIYPDIPSYTTRNDLVNNKDTQMNLLRDIVKNNKELPPLHKIVKPSGPVVDFDRKKEYILNGNTELEVDDSNIIPEDQQVEMNYREVSYVSKFNYFLLYLDRDIERLNFLGGNLVTLEDSKGNQISIATYELASSYDGKDLIVISPSSELIPGESYTVKVKPLTIVDVNSKYNSNEISFTVTNE